VGNVYVIVETPTVRPCNKPEVEPTEATAVLLVLQVPPVGEEFSVAGVPNVHKLKPESKLDVIGAGGLLRVAFMPGVEAERPLLAQLTVIL